MQILWLAIAILLGYQMSGVLINLNTDPSMNKLAYMLEMEDEMGNLPHLKINMATRKPAFPEYHSSDYWMRVGLMNGLAVLALIPMCSIRAADAEIGARARG